MSERLKSAISKLYRPNPLGRQVITLSQADAERLPPLQNVAIISITSPERPPAQLGGFEYILRLTCEDVDFLNPELSTRAQAKLQGAFTSAQAELICTFVNKLPGAVHTLVIHCAGGFSRSAGVAVGLHRIYGYQVEEERLQQANPSIIQVFAAMVSGKQKRQRRR